MAAVHVPPQNKQARSRGKGELAHCGRADLAGRMACVRDRLSGSVRVAQRG